MTINLDICKSFTPKYVTSDSAWTGHIPLVPFLINEVKPHIFVELGTHSGSSYFSFCQSVTELNLNTHCYAVDSWEGDNHSGRYSNKIFDKVESYNHKNYEKFSTLHRMKFDCALDLFEDNSVNLLHIDGFHSYEAVKNDFDTWYPKLAQGALVIFHDTEVKSRNFGVYKYWAELTKKYKNNISFSHSSGLGILQVDDKTKDPIKKYEWLLLTGDKRKGFIFEITTYGLLLIEKIKNDQINEMRLKADLERANFFEENSYLNTTLTALEETLMAITKSRSWLITSPLRAVKSKFTIIKKIFSSLFLYRHKSLINKTDLIQAYKVGGWIGIRSYILSLENLSHKDAWSEFLSQHNDKIDNKSLYDYQGFDDDPTLTIVHCNAINTIGDLNNLVSSVLNQHYPKWELYVNTCLVSSSIKNKSLLNKLSDNRIHVEFSGKKIQPSIYFRKIKKYITSEYTFFSEDNAMLIKYCLSLFIKSIVTDRPDLIYSDQIDRSFKGKKFDLIFRPGYSKVLLKSKQYISGFYCVRTNLVNNYIIDSEKYSDNFFNYEILLNLSESFSSVVHIPEILYFSDQGRRVKSKSFRNELLKLHKNYSKKHTEFNFISLSVDGLANYKYSIPQNSRVAIIIPTKNNTKILKACLDSLKRTIMHTNYDVIIIDHESDNIDDINFLNEIKPSCNVIKYSGPFNFSKINNYAVSKLDKNYTHYLFCNNDIEAIESGWLEEMLGLCSHKDIGIVGANLLYPDINLYQHAGVCVGMHGCAEHYGKYSHRYKNNNVDLNPGYNDYLISNREVSAVTAACLLIKSDIFNLVKGFDESFHVGFGDVDLCLRVRQRNYSIIQCARSTLYHYESYSRKKTFSGDPHIKDTQLFLSRWKTVIRSSDIFYSPNLDTSNHEWLPILPLIYREFYIRRKIVFN